jgi:NADH-quinone oxidoreductase subunit N
VDGVRADRDAVNFHAPHIAYAGISPVIALTAGICAVIVGGVLSDRRQRIVVSTLSLVTLAAAAGLCIWQWGEREDLVAGALRLDELALAGALIAIASAAFVIPLSWREPAAERPGAEPRHAEFQALLLSSVLGMVLLAQAQNLIAFFVSLELLSVPLYVMCGSAVRRAQSLESGLKYLIVGSLGSATLLYGLALTYGGAGSTDFTSIRDAVGSGLTDDPLVLMGIALAATGLAFKISIAPFHQWTPDVYQGAPTPVTTFMAVATKAAAFCVFVRFFEVALGPAVDNWQPALAVLAAVSIAVGNIGALGQSSLKRLLGYSGVAQAGYMLVGLVAASTLGIDALVFYLAAYALMNLAAFAVIVVRERETGYGDDINGVQGLGRDRPALAWPLTISMLALAGLPATAGFMGKLYLIEAAVDADYTWLGVAIAIGTMISLAYYLSVVAAVWMRPAAEPLAPEGPEIPAMAGGSPEADEYPPAAEEASPPHPPRGARCVVILASAALAAGATVFFGIIPSPLVDWASNAGQALAAFIP